MPGSSDGTVEIHIAGILDSSLEASTEKAVAQLDELAASAEASLASLSTAIAEAQNKSATPNGKADANKAAEQARRTADELAQIWKQVDDKKIEGEEKANSALLALGEKSVGDWRTQALKLEKAREDADARYLSAREKSDAGNTAALAKDYADQQLLAEEAANRRAAIDDEYQQKTRAANQAALQEFIKSENDKLTAGLAALDKQYGAQEINASQRHASEVALTQAIENEALQRFDAENAALAKGTAAYDDAMKRRAQIVDGFTAHVRTEDKVLADEQAASWMGANNEITAAESSLVGDIFNKRQSLNADLLQIGRQLVVQELQNDLKYWTERELLSVEGVSREKMTEQGGVLQKLLFDQTATTSAVTSQAQQNAAVTAGVTLQNTVKSAGNEQGMAQQAASASKTIMTDAAQAASGAYQSASQIPVVGWILGPVAGAAAFAAVAAYDSFAVGADNIPHDMVAQIHKGEMIIPAGPASALRSGQAGFNAGFNAGAMQGGDTYNRSDATTHQWNYAPQISGVPERNVMDELRGSAAEFASFVMGLQRSGAMRFG
jgi:hypothetical protein